MSRCVSDRALLLLYAGEGTPLQRTHVQECPDCMARHQCLIRDLQIIGDVLQEAPPHTVAHRSSVFFRPWRPITAAFAGLLIFLWLNGGRESVVHSPVQQPTPQRIDVQGFLEDHIAPALFSTVDTTLATVPAPVDHLTYVQAALAGEWPCERQGVFGHLTCEMHPFPLLIEGH